MQYAHILALSYFYIQQGKLNSSYSITGVNVKIVAMFFANFTTYYWKDPFPCYTVML